MGRLELRWSQQLSARGRCRAPLTITSSLPNPPRSRSLATLFAIAAALALLAVGSAPASAANVLPDASFGVFPSDPVSGETVRFVSYACDPDGSLAELAWDLDNDGSWDDAAGRAARWAFPAGSHRVSLRATDSSGAQSFKSRLVSVVPGSLEYVVPRLFTPPLLSPFPVVRLAGRISNDGTRLRLFSIEAPTGARVVVTCRGRSCPFRLSARSAVADPGKGKVHSSASLRIRQLEKRVLKKGVRVTIYVTKPGTIGKYVQFKFRKARPPKRVDRCLMPSAPSKPVQCPS